MKVECFECGDFVEGEDLEGLTAAFITHGKEAHSWTYPETAVKNYAVNYAEAVERLSPPSERVQELTKLRIVHVTETQVADWLHFFDHDAFVGNPGWASCYCLDPHAPAGAEEPERPWRTSRKIMEERIISGATFGYLAYEGDKAVAWVNASLRSSYGKYRFDDLIEPSAGSVIGVSCFAVAPPYRKHGIAFKLLERVVLDAPSRGADWVEGYPHIEPEAGDAGHFKGTFSMYEKLGFEKFQERGNYQIMRLKVAMDAD